MSSLLYRLIKTSYVQPNLTKEEIKDELYGPFKGEIPTIHKNHSRNLPFRLGSMKNLKEQYEKDEKAHELRKQKIEEYKNKYINYYPSINDTNNDDGYGDGWEHYKVIAYDKNKRGKRFIPGTINTVTIPNEKTLKEFQKKLEKLNQMEDLLQQSESKRDWSKHLVETAGYPLRHPTRLYEPDDLYRQNIYDTKDVLEKEKLIQIDNNHNTNKLNDVEYNQKPFFRRFMEWVNPYYSFN